MKNFEMFGLADPLLRAIAAEGYETPTPIQEQTIPVFIDGQDILGIAQTGTGKTAAFTLPLLDHIMKAKRNRTPKTSTALVVAPTRELASQIVETVRRYSKFTKINVALVVGGVRIGGQIKALRGGVDIVVATPGRLLDLMNSGAMRLDKTERVVLDEADQMMDLGFLPAIRKIMAGLPQDRVTGMFSATMPKEIRKLATEFLNHPQEIAVAAVSKPIERIEQSVERVAKQEKRAVLTRLLLGDGVERAIVFTRTKRGADRVCAHLKGEDIAAVVIHGDKTQSQRDRALKQFKDGRGRVLVATDIAARGIDIDGVSHVFNFDLPEMPEAYVHRIGRTARAGRSGVAVSLCDPSERHLLRAIEKLTGYSFSPDEAGPRNGARSGEERAEKPKAKHDRPKAGPARRKPTAKTVPNKGFTQAPSEPTAHKTKATAAKRGRRNRRPHSKGRYGQAAA